MIDWDDVRYFLAVARGGSVRKAADRLGVNHATVIRRVAQLEAQLGARLFEKLPSGYRMTGAGEEVMGLAEQMEASSNALQSRVLGRDQGVRGLLRVTMAPTVATHLLMPDLAEFARRHPEVEVSLLSLDEPVNLTNREADVAVRVVYDRDALPPNLHGHKGPELFGSVYLSRELLAAWRRGEAERVRWVLKDNIGLPDWARSGEDGARGDAVQDQPRRRADRRGAPGAGPSDAALLRRRRRPAAGPRAGLAPAPARRAVATHPGRDAQDRARTAVHPVRVGTARGLRPVAGRSGPPSRLTPPLLSAAQDRCADAQPL